MSSAEHIYQHLHNYSYNHYMQLPSDCLNLSETIWRQTLTDSESKPTRSSVKIGRGCENYTQTRDMNKHKTFSKRIKGRCSTHNLDCSNHGNIPSGTTTVLNSMYTPSTDRKNETEKTKYSMIFLNKLYQIPPHSSTSKTTNTHLLKTSDILCPLERVAPLLTIHINGLEQQCTALIDSGSGGNFISYSFVKRLQCHLHRLKNPESVRVAAVEKFYPSHTSHAYTSKWVN